MLDRDQRAIDDPPIVGLEQAALILDRGLGDLAEDGDAGVVDPGVEAAEAGYGRRGD